MNVLLLGATGRVGRLFAHEALARGHALTAVVRRPEKLGELENRLRVLKGDALDGEALSQGVAGQDAVVYALGSGNVRQTTLFSDSIKVLLKAMAAHGVRRLICVTGVGAGETKGHGGFLYDRVLYPLFTRGIYSDKDTQEDLIRQSALDWTIVRPASFRSRPAKGPLQAVTDVEGVTLKTISPPEVATFLADELDESRYIRQAVFLGHP